MISFLRRLIFFGANCSFQGMYIIYIYMYIFRFFQTPPQDPIFFYQRKLDIIWFALALLRWKCSTCFVKGEFFEPPNPKPDIGNIIFHSPTGKGQNRYMPCNPCIGLFRRPVYDPPVGGWLAMVQRPWDHPQTRCLREWMVSTRAPIWLGFDNKPVIWQPGLSRRNY